MTLTLKKLEPIKCACIECNSTILYIITELDSGAVLVQCKTCCGVFVMTNEIAVKQTSQAYPVGNGTSRRESYERASRKAKGQM